MKSNNNISSQDRIQNEVCWLLDDLDFIENYFISDGALTLTLNDRLFLSFLLQFKSYVIPDDYLIMYEEPNGLYTTLIFAIANMSMNLETQDLLIPLEDLARSDTRSVLKMGGPHYIAPKLAVYAPPIPSRLYKYYNEMCEMWISHIKTQMPLESLDDDYYNFLAQVSFGRSFEEIAEKLDISIEDTKERVWHCLKCGYLRVIH